MSLTSPEGGTGHIGPGWHQSGLVLSGQYSVGRTDACLKEFSNVWEEVAVR